MNILTLLLATLLAMPAYAQEHEHGKGRIPDWYDLNCCSNQDCKPVSDNEIELGEVDGRPYARHKPTGVVFLWDKFRRSQDERYHICANKATGAPLCFYDRVGM
jgi:hypothetical protein